MLHGPFELGILDGTCLSEETVDPTIRAGYASLAL